MSAGRLLTVDGEPFLVVGAELHNSSASTVVAIGRSFARAAALGANTILAPVAWEQLEPEEGRFDFTLVDEMLDTARAQGVRLIPLWFGSWKNGMSSYVPRWVKLDPDRFPRARVLDGEPIEHLSPFAPNAAQADVAAFRALMAHLADVDTVSTVVMVQVENEVGLLRDSRDRGPLAEAAHRQPVPIEVLEAVAASPGMPVHADWVANGSRSAGPWAEVFGDGPAADEAFMAYAYASHIEQVARAGRAELDVPLYVNAWLDAEKTADEQALMPVALAGGTVPGVYPSGGPLPRVAPIWRAAAPSIDLLAPDIYFGDFDAIATSYVAASGRLFIPEMRRSPRGVGQMITAVGRYGACGVSPFGVDSLDVTDPDWRSLHDGYRLLRIAAEVLRIVPDAATAGFHLDGTDDATELTLGDVELRVQRRRAAPGVRPVPAFGLVMEEAPGVLTVLGRGFTVQFADVGPSPLGILSAAELDLADGRVAVTRYLNGDETGSGGYGRFLPLDPPDGPLYPIPSLWDGTGAARFELYRY